MDGNSNYNEKEENEKIPLNLIISKAFEYHANGDIAAARKFYQFLIDKGYKDPRVFTNYGNIEKGDDRIDSHDLLSPYAVDKYCIDLYAKLLFVI